MGLMKKLLIADFLAANLVNRVFDFPNLYSGTETLIAVYAYACRFITIFPATPISPSDRRCCWESSCRRISIVLTRR